MSLHLLVEGRGEDRSLCVFTLSIVHNLAWTQIGKSHSFNIPCSTNSINLCIHYRFDSTTVFDLLHL
jgi:hypothetical protein